MKAKGFLYCGGGCRQETIKPHWHPVYESCFGNKPVTARAIDEHVAHPEKEVVFIDWDYMVDAPVIKYKREK